MNDFMFDRPKYIALSNACDLDCFVVSEKQSENQLTLHDRFLKNEHSFNLEKTFLNISQMGVQSFKFLTRFDDIFIKDFEAVKSQISQKKLDKAVIYNTLVLEGKIEPHKILNSIKENPHFLYAAWGDDSGFIGLSPELLFRSDKSDAKTFAIAGTAKDKKILQETKYLEEQKIVLEGISHALDSIDLPHFIEKKKSIEYNGLFHLYNEIGFSKKNRSSKEIIKALHPTAAIGGYPKAKFKEYVQFLEHIKNPRIDYYGGLFHFKNTHKEICIVMIRGIFWKNNKVFIHAGCGVTKDSRLEDELVESKNKIKSVMEYFNLELH